MPPRPTPETDGVRERPVMLDDIRQTIVNSTTTTLEGPDGTTASVHLAWVITVGPMDEDDETLMVDENGVLYDEDRAMLEDGDHVLNHDCLDRRFVYVAADPQSARGTATAVAANMLVGLASANRQHATVVERNAHPSGVIGSGTGSPTFTADPALKSTTPQERGEPTPGTEKRPSESGQPDNWNPPAPTAPAPPKADSKPTDKGNKPAVTATAEK